MCARFGMIVLAVIVWLWPMDGYPRKIRTIAFVPDPSCQSSPLLTEVEKAFSENFKVKDVQLEEKKKSLASIQVQYFLLVRREEEQMVVQLNGQVFDNTNENLLVEATAASDPGPNDDNGRRQAAYQAGQRLAESLSVLLTEQLFSKKPRRRVMLQVTLDDDTLGFREEIVRQLKNKLQDQSPNLKASTERNLTMMLYTSENAKELVKSIEKILLFNKQLKPNWVIQSERTLIVRIILGSK